MPTFDTDDVTIGSIAIPETRFMIGDHFPELRKRTVCEGWGFDIELLAVLDILEAVSAGLVSADDARKGLLEAVNRMYGPNGCFDYESAEDRQAWCERDGGCEACRRHQSDFERLVADAEGFWRRYQQPEKYPFTAGKKGLHETGCSVVKRAMPKQFSRPVGSQFSQALREYAHAANPFMDTGNYEDFDGCWNRAATYPTFRPMTVAEARAWTAQNTGPKGGRNYKPCRVCAPAL
ncbi:hypothetical protein OG787_08115 [Streptomyces sp. NBC_00075]|uniref:Phage protein n=1 Tax=Streptomyces sp. NBC_00093 TaxID=2975649 RepID=A0AAU1ZTN4_9ACTN